MNPLRVISDWLHGYDIDRRHTFDGMTRKGYKVRYVGPAHGERVEGDEYSGYRPASGGYAGGGGPIVFGVDFGSRGDSIIGSTFDQNGAMTVLYEHWMAAPRFGLTDTVWVESMTYGRHLSMVVDLWRCGDHWRYMVNDQALHPSFKAGGRKKRLLSVHESALERYQAPRPWDGPIEPPTDSVDASLIAWQMGQGIPLNTAIQGIWGFSNSSSSLADLKEWAETHGKDWTSPVAQTQYMVEKLGANGGLMVLPNKSPVTKWISAEDQGDGHTPGPKDQYEPLHWEFLTTINYLLVRDPAFAEKMRDDLLELWHEDKVAKGLTAPQALGMTEEQYSAWVEKKGSGQ